MEPSQNRLDKPTDTAAELRRLSEAVEEQNRLLRANLPPRNTTKPQPKRQDPSALDIVESLLKALP